MTLVFHLSPEGTTAFEGIMRLSECAEPAKCVRNALNVYDLLLKELAKGSEILIRESDGQLARLDILTFEASK